ncbi:Rv3235 family protein [Streptomyces sp. DSM 15324]|uniref:Rv3235 family protein n=1 Tax=Streptomyces sp. DSM 15324 TaxID=1739111 RepID=UPI001F35DFCE|nr:Rv3235 family protein [Streptomyces sp. DSM 15324]
MTRKHAPAPRTAPAPVTGETAGSRATGAARAGTAAPAPAGTRPPATAPATAGTRPPGRRDPRRPAGTPPRTRQAHAPATRRPAPAATAPAPSPQRPSPAPPQPRPTDLFADRLLAVLSGRRPVHSMLRHTLGSAYDDLSHLAERGPLRTTRGAGPTVRDIGYYVPRPGAIEAFARIGTGDRLRAMAFRLELGTDHRWRCTAVELDGPRRPRDQDD